MKRLAHLFALARSARLEHLYGINRRNVDLVYAHNARADYPCADDKLACKAILERAGVPVPQTLATCRGLFEVDGVAQQLRAEQHFVVKPAGGSGGDGVTIVGEREDAVWRTPGGRRFSDDDLRQHLANIVFGAFSHQLDDNALVERRVVPAPLFREFWADGVCDIRVLCLRGKALLAMVRIPTQRSQGRANLHKGGVGLAVDLETGRATHAAWKAQAITHHPESGERLVGRQLPEWCRTLEVAEAAAKAVPLGYVGVDIAVDEQLGPVVLELNARPGLEIQNVCQVTLGEVLERAGVHPAEVRGGFRS